MGKTKEEKNRYINEWKKQNKDRLYIIVPKGKKEQWKEHAQQHNLSLSQLVSIAIDNYIEQDNTQEQDKNTTTHEQGNKSISHKSGITFNR